MVGGQETVGDVGVLQAGQRVGPTGMETQEVLDVVLLPVVIHHERSRGHYRGGVNLGRELTGALTRASCVFRRYGDGNASGTRVAAAAAAATATAEQQRTRDGFDYCSNSAISYRGDDGRGHGRASKRSNRFGDGRRNNNDCGHGKGRRETTSTVVGSGTHPFSGDTNTLTGKNQMVGA